MPSSNGSSLPFASFRRPILGIRSEQVHSETIHDPNILNLESFQSRVFTIFNSLSASNHAEFLSISWIHKLLDAFISCHEEFKVVLLSFKEKKFLKPPADKLSNEFFERSIKALDIFNASRDGIEKIRLWHKHLEILVCALDTRQRTLGEGQFRRARKALTDLALVMLEDKDTSLFSPKNRSFGHKLKDPHHRVSGHTRSQSWGVSHSWSASKQLQSMANNLFPPRSNEIASTDGLAILLFTMSFIMMFVLWALVAAIPCQDRGTNINFTIPRNFSWTAPLFLLHSRIVDESKKRDRRNPNGLLNEIYEMEKNVNRLTDLVDSARFPLSEEAKEEVRVIVNELSFLCEVCKNGLDPLERLLREVFRKITSCRTECIELWGKATEP